MKFSTESRRVAAAAVLLLAFLGGLACVTSQRKIRHQKRSAAHVALARRLIEQHRLHEALTQTNLALEEWKKNPAAFHVRGQIRFGLELYLQSVDDFTQAMEFGEDVTESLVWRAWARAESGDFAAAEHDWLKALGDPHYPTPEKIHLNLALYYLRDGRRDNAVSHIERAVQMNPAYSRGHYELGKLRQESGDLDGAIVSFQAALGGLKNSPEVNLRLALVLEESGEGARAREHFKRVIELSPDGPEADTARDHLKRLESAT
jgi:Tfp pilus assembly protein PilF